MREKRREREVPEERVPVEDCIDGGLPQRNLQQFIL